MSTGKELAVVERRPLAVVVARKAETILWTSLPWYRSPAAWAFFISMTGIVGTLLWIFVFHGGELLAELGNLAAAPMLVGQLIWGSS